LFDTPPEPAAQPNAAAAHADAREREQRHLVAARRLARRIARLPDQSPAQLHAGRMICRHLVAMLKEAEAQSSIPPH
jgi:hypothetical protein